MKIAVALSVLPLFVVACTGAPAISPTPGPTPDIQATVNAAVAATVAALVTPTPATTSASVAELNNATSRAAFLTARYGVDPKQVASLTKSTYDAAARLKLGTPEQRTALDMTVLNFAEHGGPGLRDFGVEGDDTSVARQLGLSSGQALQAFTTGEIVQARTAIATIGLTRFVIGN